MLEDDELKNYVDAARVATGVRQLAEDLIKPGASLLSIATKIEEETLNAGGGIAFPVNISLNEIAAHYTPKIGDESVLGENDVASIDFGVHVKGCIIDQAFSVDLSGEQGKLVEASEAALSEALSVIKAGANVSEVGKKIGDAIVSRGFKPIENLCGHSLLPFMLHAGEEIPNVARGDYVLEEGDVFAVEPFATTGVGRVEDGSYCQIYSISNPKNVRLPQSRKAIEYVFETFQTLPFAKRHLLSCLPSSASVDIAISDLLRQEIIRGYPVLKEVNNGVVTQAETTVIVEKDAAKVLA